MCIWCMYISAFSDEHKSFFLFPLDKSAKKVYNYICCMI